MWRTPTLSALLLALILSPLYAQDSADKDSPVPPDPPSAVSEAGNVSLDFRDADIQNVLRILAYKSGVNIVAGPEVTGLVTIQLRDVPWQKALEVMLSTYGYGYERKGNIITVTTIENLKKRRDDAQVLTEQEPLVTKTFVLNYAKAGDVIVSLQKMKTERGSIDFDVRTNSLIVRDISDNVDLISEVITQLDRTTPQVLIEAKIVETTVSNTESLGVDWSTKFTVTGAERPTTFPFQQTSKNQYLRDPFIGTDDTLGNVNTEFSYGTINFTQLQAVLEMLSTRTDTNILSNPRIVTVDNQKARIVVGQEYPFPNYEYNQEQAKMVISGWDYKDIGIIFEVTPHVNEAGFVTLDIEPKVTAILGFVKVADTSVPQLSKEEAKTKVMIKGGETLVIAGLIRDEVKDIKKKVPFLGDIPILGLMFQKKEKTIEKKDLLIFLTPHILNVDTPQKPKEN